ncbi:MAG: hypothetical protein ACRDBI_08055 [Shewanella sp.]
MNEISQVTARSFLFLQIIDNSLTRHPLLNFTDALRREMAVNKLKRQQRLALIGRLLLKGQLAVLQ